MNTEIPIYCNGKYSLVEETLNLGICVLLFYHFFYKNGKHHFIKKKTATKIGLTFR